MVGSRRRCCRCRCRRWCCCCCSSVSACSAVSAVARGPPEQRLGPASAADPGRARRVGPKLPGTRAVKGGRRFAVAVVALEGRCRCSSAAAAEAAPRLLARLESPRLSSGQRRRGKSSRGGRGPAARGVGGRGGPSPARGGGGRPQAPQGLHGEGGGRAGNGGSCRRRRRHRRRWCCCRRCRHCFSSSSSSSNSASASAQQAPDQPRARPLGRDFVPLVVRRRPQGHAAAAADPHGGAAPEELHRQSGELMRVRRAGVGERVGRGAGSLPGPALEPSPLLLFRSGSSRSSSGGGRRRPRRRRSRSSSSAVVGAVRVEVSESALELYLGDDDRGPPLARPARPLRAPARAAVCVGDGGGDGGVGGGGRCFRVLASCSSSS